MKAFILPLLVSTSIIGSIFGILEIKEKSVILPDDTKLTYQVDEKNKMNGLFTVINTSQQPLIRGSYKEDKRSGNWYCFSNDKSVFMRYNYDLNKVLYLDTVAIKKATIKVLSNNKEVAENASISLPVCSIDQYVSLLNEEIKASIPQNQVVYNRVTDFEITATIDEKNRVEYKYAYMFGNNKFERVLKPRASKFNIDWIPAMYADKAVASEFRVYSQITFTADNNRMSRFNWSN